MSRVRYLSKNFEGSILSDDELLKRFEKIKPILKINEKDYLVSDISLEALKDNKELLFSGKEDEKVKYVPFKDRDFTWMLDTLCIVLVKDLCPKTVSIATILSQLPEELLNEVVAFKTKDGINLIGYNEYLHDISSNGCTILSLELYRKRTKLKLLDDEKLTELNEKIMPLITKEDGKNYTCAEKFSIYDIKHTSYTWDKERFVEEVDFRKLTPIAQVEMLHTYGYYGLFKPTIAEVLSQIPKEYIDRTVAFKIIDRPMTSSDFSKHKKTFDDGFHTSVVELYEENLRINDVK